MMRFEPNYWSMFRDECKHYHYRNTNMVSPSRSRECRDTVSRDGVQLCNFRRCPKIEFFLEYVETHHREEERVRLRARLLQEIDNRISEGDINRTFKELVERVFK